MTAEMPDLSSPHDYMEIILENWGFDFRGDEPTKEEVDAFFSWAVNGGECPLPEPRGIQVCAWLFDEHLGPVAKAPGKVLRAREDSDDRWYDLEALARALNVQFDWHGQNFNVLDLWIEEQCASLAMRMLAGVISRWKGLRAVTVDHAYSDTTLAYLEEASSAYLFGHYRACVALCRSVLEAALRDVLPGIPMGSEHGLKELIDLAESERMLVGKTLRFAHSVRTEANKVVHPRTAVSAGLAREVLAKVAEVIDGLL